MACQIQRTQDGKIVKVLTPQGTESKVFNQIAKLPHVTDLEMAVDIYDEVLKANPQLDVNTPISDNDIRFQIIGEQGARNLDQAEEATTRLDNLSVAREMESAKKTTKEVKLATGWERGADGKWRYEISDITPFQDIKVTEGLEPSGARGSKAVLFLSDIAKSTTKNATQAAKKRGFSIQNILDAYPQLGDVVIRFEDSTDGAQGSYSGGVITLNSNLSPKEADSVLLHELQHAIQDIEGFAKGGDIVEAFEDLEVYKAALRDKLGENSTEYKNIVKRLDENEEGISAREIYTRLAGETEARNVQKRANMSTEQRRQSLLQETEDVAREDQIFLQSSLGSSLSARTENQNEQLLQGVYQQLQKANLADNTYFLTNQEIEDKLKELGYSDDIIKSIIAYHGTTKNISSFLKQSPTEGKYGQILSGTYFGEGFIAYSFAGGSPFNSPQGKMFKAKIDDSSFYTVDMKGTTPSNDAGIIKTIGQEEFDKILKLKQEGKIKGLRLNNTREFLAGETKPTTQYVVYDNNVVEILKELRQEQADVFQPQFQVSAYHGSPYSFDRFTTNAMGTGEGAQAFGWGLYFTDLESIARNYAKVLSKAKQNYLYKGNIIFGEGGYKVKPNESLEYDIATQIVSDGGTNSEFSFGKSKERLIEYFKYDNNKEGIDKLNTIKYSDFSTVSPEKNLYKVSLHKGKEVSEYTWLEWDKPMSDKTLELFQKFNKEQGIKLSEPTEPINKKDRITSGEMYKWLSEKIGTKEASLFLLENGIDGVKYPAESISRGATSDNARGFNYVVFDENAITIEEQLQFQKDQTKVTTNGFTINNDVYVNTESKNPIETLLHENSHIYLNKLKETNPEMYQAGMDLVNGADPLLKEIIDFVKTNQPNLKEGTEKFANEILAEITGRRAFELLSSKEDSNVKTWLENFFEWLKDKLGLTQYTNEQVAQMTLADYSDAIGVDMLKGNELFPGQNIGSNNAPQFQNNLTGGAAFATFFADVTNTKDGGSNFKDVSEVLEKPTEGYEEELKAYLKYGKNFQKHIMTSIPGFVDVRIRTLKGMANVAELLGKNGKEVSMLDITSSEGYYTKAWAQLAQDRGVNATADALDAGVTFQRDFEEAPQVKGVKFLLEAWGESFVDPVSGKKIPLFKAKKKYSIVYEGMGFQFFTPTRDKEIKETKALMEKDGVFITKEKFKNPDYTEREVLKDEFKSSFYSQEQLKAKAARVLNKSEESTTGMSDYQVDRLEYEKVLKNNFKYVVQIYSSGNFAGYIASDSLDTVKATLEGTGDTTTRFNFESTPSVIKGEDLNLDTIWDLSRGPQKLEGAPNIKGATGATPELSAIAERYAEQNGIDYRRQKEYVAVDETRAERIAKAYEEMEHKPNDPKVKEAYQNLIKQTKAQYKMLEEAGYKFYLHDETNDPYDGNPSNAMRDLRGNKVMAVFATEGAYGQSSEELNTEDNPMLEDTGMTWGYGGLNGPKRRVLANDLFRAVHDAFGHGLEGASFRAKGEENAWQAHARLFTGSAVAAITSETRGQNSWLNYGPYAEQNRTAKVEDTIFAEQKVGLMSDWTWKEGFDEGVERPKYRASAPVPTPNNTSSQINRSLPKEPTLEIQSNGKTYSSFEKAMRETDSNTVEIVSNGVTVATLPTTVDTRTIEGVVNNLIVNGIISGDKLQMDGKTYYTPKGHTPHDRTVTEEFLKEYIGTMLPKASYKIKDGLIEFKETKIEPMEEGSMGRTILDMILDYFTGGSKTTGKKVDEENLRLNLLTILNDLGVSVISMGVYQNRFGKKNSQQPSASAMADIANRVIAFKDGQLSLEDLTEETMHFIVETFTQEQIDELRDMIRNSQEYKDHYEQYREAYNNNEALIEKEILGKIMKNIALGKLKNKDKNLIDRILEYIRDFFNNLNVNQTHRDQLAELNKTVEQLVFQQSQKLNQADLAKSNEIAIMYSLQEEVEQTAASLKSAFSNAKEVKHLSGYKQLLEGENFNELLGKQLVPVIGRYIEMTDRLINTTEAALIESKKEKKNLAEENLVILNDLKNEISSQLSSLAAELSQPQVGIDPNKARTLAEKLSEQISIIDRISAENLKLGNENILDMAQRIGEQYGMLENEFFMEHLEKAIKGEVEDVNYLFSYFGQLHHSSNPILNLISKKIWESKMIANQGIKEDLARVQNMAEEMKLSPAQIQSLFDHRKGFMKSRIDQKAFQDAQDIKTVEAYEKYAQNEIEPSEDLDETRHSIDLLAQELNETKGSIIKKLKKLQTYKKLQLEKKLEKFSEETTGKYLQTLDELQSPLMERPMADAYYEEITKRYEDLGIKGETLSFLKQQSRNRGAIKRGASKQVGDKERVVYSPTDNNNLTSISKIRKAKKAIYDQTGFKKRGIVLHFSEPVGDFVEISSGVYITLDLSQADTQLEKEDAQITYDLNKIDKAYMDELNNPNSPTQARKTSEDAKDNFMDYISYLFQTGHSEQEVFDAVAANVNFNLNQDYYNNFEASFLDGDTLLELNPDKALTIKDLKEAYLKRQSILSSNRSTSNPFEIEHLSPSSQKEVRNLTNDIQALQRTLKLPESETASESVGVREPNESYRQHLDKNNIEEGSIDELNYLLTSEHTDREGLKRLETARYKFENSLPMTNAEKAMVRDYLATTESYDMAKLAYLRDKLAPYYKRSVPKDYKSIAQRQKEGDSLQFILADMIQDINPYLDVRIDPSFEDDVNPFKNENYQDNYVGGGRQPAKGKFIDKAFVDRFGLTEDGVATKETGLYEFYQEYLNTRIKGNEKMDDKAVNPYKLIQISRTTTQQIRDIISTKSGFKDRWSSLIALVKDTFAYRIDDMAYGEKDYKVTRIIPRYYNRDLESMDDVSTDYMMSLNQYLTRANERSAKKEVIHDIESLYQSLLKTKNSAKGSDLKKTMQMVDNFVDDYIYGQVEGWKYGVKVPGTNYTVDLAKVTRLFTKYVSIKNLGYNVIVPLTGALSAQSTKMIEQFIGERLNKDSSALGNKEFSKLMSDATRQSLDWNDNSKLFLIGQAFNVYDMGAKVRNAAYNKFQRTFSKSAMGLHTVSNFVVTPRILLSILYDNRFVNGKIQTRQQFLQEGLREGKDRPALIATWRAAQEKNIYDSMDFTKEGFKWKPSVLSNILTIPNGMTAEQVQEEYLKRKAAKANPITDFDKEVDKAYQYLDDRKTFLIEYIQEQVSGIEGQLPQEMRVLAQRHALGSMALLHKGYLSVFLQRRLKQRNLNLATGNIEEGSYRTLGSAMASMFTDPKEGLKRLALQLKPPTKGEFTDSSGNFDSKAFRDAQLTHELEIRNLKRVYIEMGGMLSLVLIGALIFAMATDPDNEDNYAIQLGAYLMQRVQNEQATGLTPSIFRDVAQTIKEPLTTYSSFQEIGQTLDIFNGDEVENGKYRGLTKRERWLTKNTFGAKGIYDMYSAENIIQTRNIHALHNQNNIDWASLSTTWLLKQAYDPDKEK